MSEILCCRHSNPLWMEETSISRANSGAGVIFCILLDWRHASFGLQGWKREPFWIYDDCFDVFFCVSWFRSGEDGKGNSMLVSGRVAEVARKRGWHPPKSLDSDDNFKPEHTPFCRELRFVAIYPLFGDLWAKKVPVWVKTVFLGQDVHYCTLYIAYYWVKFAN